MNEVKDYMITEYTVVERKGHNHHYYVIQLGQDMYYRDENSESIRVVREDGFEARFLKKSSAEDNANFLKKFYDEKGRIKQEIAER